MSTRAIRGPFRFDTFTTVTTGNYTVVNDSLVIVNKTVGAPTTITLPASAVTPNSDGSRRVVEVHDGKGDAATNNITINAAGTDTVNGGASVTIASNYGVLRLLDLGGGAWAVDPASAGLPALGVNATANEINAAADVSARLIDQQTATMTITSASHSGRIVLLDSTHTQTITLPTSTGGGDIYHFIVKTTGTDGSKVIQVANTVDVISGASWAANTQNTIDTFLTSATSDTVTLNNSTTGGVAGTEVIITDIAAGTFNVRVHNITTGNPATPFSAAV